MTSGGGNRTENDLAGTRHSALPPSLPPRLIRREAAAEYVGVSPSKFDRMVEDGRMPKPRIADRCRLYCVRELDAACDRLPHVGGETDDTSWDDLLDGAPA